MVRTWAEWLAEAPTVESAAAPTAVEHPVVLPAEEMAEAAQKAGTRIDSSATSDSHQPESSPNQEVHSMGCRAVGPPLCCRSTAPLPR